MTTITCDPKSRKENFTHNIDVALAIQGSAAALADYIGVSISLISSWKKNAPLKIVHKSEKPLRKIAHLLNFMQPTELFLRQAELNELLEMPIYNKKPLNSIDDILHVIERIKELKQKHGEEQTMVWLKTLASSQNMPFEKTLELTKNFGVESVTYWLYEFKQLESKVKGEALQKVLTAQS